MLEASIDFSGVREKVKSDYLDVYDGVYAEVISTNRFDEDTDLSTTYLPNRYVKKDRGKN